MQAWEKCSRGPDYHLHPGALWVGAVTLVLALVLPLSLGFARSGTGVAVPLCLLLATTAAVIVGVRHDNPGTGRST